jgi:hypothetical protein
LTPPAFAFAGRHFAESRSDAICAGEGGIGMNEFCAKKQFAQLIRSKEEVMRIDTHAHYYLLGCAER